MRLGRQPGAAACPALRQRQGLCCNTLTRADPLRLGTTYASVGCPMPTHISTTRNCVHLTCGHTAVALQGLKLGELAEVGQPAFIWDVP